MVQKNCHTYDHFYIMVSTYEYYKKKKTFEVQIIFPFKGEDQVLVIDQASRYTSLICTARVTLY